MRTSALFLIAIIFACASADTLTASVKEMMTANAMASDAVDTVEQLLLELKDSIYQEQADHDARWAQQQIDCAKTIADLTAVANRNREIAEDATEHREWVEAEIQDSHDHLEWIDNRLATIAAKLVQLNVTRCESNQLFIQQLKEHQDALDAIAILRTELDRTEAAGQAPVFAQTEGTFTNKLAEYEHLFEANALNTFFQNKEVEIPEAHTDLEDFEYLDETASGRDESGHVYTHRDELDTEAFESTVDTSDLVGTLHDKVNAMLDRLQSHLEENAALLESNEIQAALDTAQFQIKSKAEVARLEADIVKRQAYLEKLAVDLEVALITEADAWELSRQSDQDVVDAKNDCAAKEAFYNQETDRRNGELADLEWVIDVFQEQVASLGDSLRNRIDDYVHDERFDSMFNRATDGNVEAGVAGSGAFGF
jgi:regulator of replication initiation timing